MIEKVYKLKTIYSCPKGIHCQKRLAAYTNLGKTEEANQLKAKVEELKQKIQNKEQLLSESISRITDILYQIPNIPNELVPEGKSEEDNVVIKEWEGSLPELHDNAIPHWELGKKYGILDFELGVKNYGSRISSIH